MSKQRVAIVCDWMVAGGAEQVVLELHRMFPYAPIYTSYCAPQWQKDLDGKVVTGFLQNWPFPRLRKFVPFLRAYWFSHLDLSAFDLVISSSGAEAKSIRVRRSEIGDRNLNNSKLTPNSKLPTTKPLHVAYIHAPTHYYWDRFESYLKEPGFGIFNPLARLGLKILVGPMRRWDYAAAQKPDVLIANSTHTKKMIKKYYGRDSTVIFPPVDTDRFQISDFRFQNPRQGFIVVGRQVPYKRIDLAVRACSELGLGLTVVGNGPEHRRLVKMAGPSVTFRTDVADGEKVDLLRSAEGFIFPNEDDFGITAVEAMAAGCPVIALKAGGALDTVEPKISGIFFENQTAKSLKQALNDFSTMKFDSERITNHAKNFDSPHFVHKIQALINKLV